MVFYTATGLQGGPQKSGTNFVRLNFINYYPIYIIPLSESEKKICNNTITKIPPHLKYVATLPCKMWGVVKAN